MYLQIKKSAELQIASARFSLLYRLNLSITSMLAIIDNDQILIDRVFTQRKKSITVTIMFMHIFFDLCYFVFQRQHLKVEEHCV